MEGDVNSQIIFKPEFFESLDMRPIIEKLLNIPLQIRLNETTLPDTLTFLEMYNVSKIEQLNISNRWKNSDSTMSLAVPVGVHANGEKFMLDLHENAHGPNGIVAGTTGSGKTEFLINYILSMSVNFSPEEVSFILIDYLNNNLISSFMDENSFVLPHIVGGITSLEDNKIYKLISSLRVEIKRREKLFDEARDITGENNIDIYKYQKYYREKVVKEPISHLFIITDEFIDIAQSNLLEELFNIIKVAKNLGFHLILSTNKPDSVFDEEVYSNNFKICFKVQTPEESITILNKPDAARIKNAGRFYFQTDYDNQLELGQASWPSAKYIPSDRLIHKQDDSICFINNIGTITKKANDIIKKENSTSDGSNQLLSTINYIDNLSTKEEYEPYKIILDALPSNLYIANLIKKYDFKAKLNKVYGLVGEYEDIENNKYELLTVNLASNTCIIGKVNAGKDELLSTIIYSVSINHSPDEVNIYYVDNNMSFIKQFMSYPIITDIATIDDYDKIFDLFIMVNNIIEERKNLISFYNNSIEEYNKENEKKLKLITIIINNFDNFINRYPKLLDIITSILKEGIKYGVTCIISSGYIDVFENKFKELFTNKLVLQLKDAKEYSKLLNMSDDRLKPLNCYGRGLVSINKKVYEFQGASIYIKNEIYKVIGNTAVTLNEKYKNNVKAYIKSIPNIPNVERLFEYVEGLQRVPIGYNLELKNKFYYNFKKNKANIITGNELDKEGKFLGALVNLFERIPGLDIKILDMNKYFDISHLSSATTCIQNNFSDAFKKIISDYDYIAKNTLYIFTGIGDIKSKFDIVFNKQIDEYFLKVVGNEKVNYLFIDNNDSLVNIKDKIWYEKILNVKEGIWLGSSLESNKILSIDSKLEDDKNAISTNNDELCLAFMDDKRYIVKKAIIVEKILVKLIIPELETEYDVYLPITKKIGNIIKLLIKAIVEMGYEYDDNVKIALYNRKTGEKYEPNKILVETNIRNGTELVLL